MNRENINLNFKPILKRNKTTIKMHESKKEKEKRISTL